MGTTRTQHEIARVDLFPGTQNRLVFNILNGPECFSGLIICNLGDSASGKNTGHFFSDCGD